MSYAQYQNTSFFKRLPINWRLKTFNDAVKDITSGNVKLKKEDYQESGIHPIVDQGKELIAGYTDDDICIANNYECIVFGDHTRIFKYVDFSFVLGADGVKVLVPKAGDIEVKYLYYFFQTLDIPNTGYNRHFKYLKDVIIPLPPLEEQKKIARVLDKAQSLIDKRKEAIAKLDELVQAVFLDMFGDPVTNPKRWELIKFSEVGSLERGKSKHRPRNASELLGGPYPLIQTGDVSNAYMYITEYEQTYSELGLQQSQMWNKGTLCVTIAANIAKTAILSFDACFPDSVVGFTPNDKTNVHYIQGWLSFLQKILEDSAPESAQKNINLKILRELEIPLPPIELQIRYEKIITAIYNKRNELEEGLKQFEGLSGALLQQAFKGELSTKDEINA